MFNYRFSLDNLSSLTDLSKRTIRYYIQMSLVPRPLGDGRAAYYVTEHLERLLKIKMLTAAGVSLERIREILDGGPAPVPPKKRHPGAIEVKSHVFLAPGLELAISPEDIVFDEGQVQTFTHSVLELAKELKPMEKPALAKPTDTQLIPEADSGRHGSQVNHVPLGEDRKRCSPPYESWPSPATPEPLPAIPGHPPQAKPPLATLEPSLASLGQSLDASGQSIGSLNPNLREEERISDPIVLCNLPFNDISGEKRSVSAPGVSRGEPVPDTAVAGLPIPGATPSLADPEPSIAFSEPEPSIAFSEPELKWLDDAVSFSLNLDAQTLRQVEESLKDPKMINLILKTFNKNTKTPEGDKPKRKVGRPKLTEEEKKQNRLARADKASKATKPSAKGKKPPKE